MLIIVLLLLSACTPAEKLVMELGTETCAQDSDCRLPMDYAIRSNCPFGSACIDNECKVVCPLYYHDLNPDVSKSYQYTCEKDKDCDCSERGNNTLECLCLEETCLSVEG